MAFNLFRCCAFAAEDKKANKLDIAVKEKSGSAKRYQKIESREAAITMECLQLLKHRQNGTGPTVDTKFFRYQVDENGKPKKDTEQYEFLLTKDQIKECVLGGDLVALAHKLSGSSTLFAFEIDPERIGKDFEIQFALQAKNHTTKFPISLTDFCVTPKERLYGYYRYRENAKDIALLAEIVLAPMRKRIA